MKSERGAGMAISIIVNTAEGSKHGVNRRAVVKPSVYGELSLRGTGLETRE
jgi:hypothetical protein